MFSELLNNTLVEETEGDEIDRLINSQKLKIIALSFFQQLDLMIIILNNRVVLSRYLSSYPFLSKATIATLNNYQVQCSGVFWPELDADLSLRGFLMEEITKKLTSYPAFAE